MQVHVLLDKDNLVYGVVTDEAAADEWLSFDPDYIAVGPIEVDDYESFHEVKESYEAAQAEGEPVELDDDA
jgi:thiamine monophosphate synthase